MLLNSSMCLSSVPCNSISRAESKNSTKADGRKTRGAVLWSCSQEGGAIRKDPKKKGSTVLCALSLNRSLISVCFCTYVFFTYIGPVDESKSKLLVNLILLMLSMLNQVNHSASLRNRSRSGSESNTLHSSSVWFASSAAKLNGMESVRNRTSVKGT